MEWGNMVEVIELLFINVMVKEKVIDLELF